MANAFKLKNHSGASVNADTFTSVYTVPSATTTIVLGLTLANLTASDIAITVTMTNTSASIVSNVTKLAVVPGKSSLEIMSGNKYVMEATDILKVKSDTANSLDTTLGIMEITA
jgi:hypothetical protein